MTTDLLADFGDIPTELLINGKWRPAADGSTLVNVSPVDERMLAEIAAAGRDLVVNHKQRQIVGEFIIRETLAAAKASADRK